MLVRLLTNNTERLAVGAHLEAEGRELVVADAREHHDRWIVHFEGVAGREAADALARAVLRAEAVLDDPDSYWVHDLVGASVVDLAGTEHGTVERVLANPASDILELSSGQLVPLRFATWEQPGGGGATPRRLVVDGPPGLLAGDG